MINNVTLVGRFTKTPEPKSTVNGTKVTTFTIAVERTFKKAGEERQTDFIDCVAWKGTADFITQWFTKGDMIGIVGTIQTRNYEDKNGSKRKAVAVLVDKVSFCGDKKKVDTSDFEEITDLPWE